MPWEDRSIMSLRQDFVGLAQQPGANVRELCRRFRISPTTGYKWLLRVDQEGPPGLLNRSRRPHSSPCRSSDTIEQRILAVRKAYPDWGGRKIRHFLLAGGAELVPAASTITEILRRHDKLDPKECAKHQAFERFEHAAPNDLWQMDFKGHFSILNGRCHPLTILDDHSRYSIAIQSCADEREGSVKEALIERFRMYGLPWRMLMDNGSPWSGQGRGLTALEAWLMRLGVRVSHGRPYHPQTQGKDERFHRTLKAAVITRRQFTDLAHCQRAFDQFREVYNHQRPHEALGMATPSQKYKASPRPYPETLPAIEYLPEDKIRIVTNAGFIKLEGRRINVGDGLNGQTVAVRPTTDEAVKDIVYCYSIIKRIDLRTYDKEH